MYAHLIDIEQYTIISKVRNIVISSMEIFLIIVGILLTLGVITTIMEEEAKRK